MSDTRARRTAASANAKSATTLADSDATNRAGVALVRDIIARRLGWIEREQSTSDYGIDLHAEQRDGLAQGTGRLLAIQVKSGSSYFRHTRGGWHYWPKPRHVQYWLRNSLPVAFVLAEPDTGRAYWAHVTSETLIKTSKGHRLFIPEVQKLVDALPAWAAIVDESTAEADSRYVELREHLPEIVAARLDAVPEALRLPARLLGAELAEGLALPADVVARYRSDPPTWFGILREIGLVAVADYAYSHGLRDAAIALYDEIIASDDGPTADCLLRKALMLGSTDPDQADDVLRQLSALSPAAEMSARACVALRESATDERLPISVSNIEGSPGRDAQLVWLHAGENLLRSGQLDLAVDLYTKFALEVRPHVAQWLLGLAQVLLMRSRRPSAPRRDRDSSVVHAGRALDVALTNRVGLEEVIIGSLTIFEGASAPMTAFRRSVGILENRDLPLSEDTRLTVASAALRAARFAGGGEGQLREVLAALPEGDPRLEKLIAAYTRTHPADDHEAAAERAAEQGEWSVVAETVLALALEGRDRTDLLPRAMGDDQQRRMSDVAQAVAGSEESMRRLRRQRHTDRMAWETFALTLARRELWEELLDELDRATALFGPAATQLHRVDALMHVSRPQEAIAAAVEALAQQPDVDAELMLRDALTSALQTKGDLDGACRQLELALELTDGAGLPPRRAWDLAHLLTRLHRQTEAAQVLSGRELTPTTTAEAGVWINAQLPYAWTQETATLALDLVERFPDDARLSKVAIGRILIETRSEQDLSSTLDARAAVSESVRERVHKMIQVRLNSPASPVQSIHLDFDGDVRQQLLEVTGEQPDHAELRRSILCARLPVGCLAKSLGHPYGAVLVRGSVGVYVATSPDDEGYEADRQDAALALSGRRIAIEPSALLISSQTGRFDEFASEFSALLTAPEVLDDVDATCRDIQGLIASVGLLDPYGPRLIREITDGDRVLLRGRADAYATAAAKCVVSDVSAALPELDDMEWEATDAAWLSPLRLARALDVPLWSDDAALRRLARAMNIPAFGSIALAEILLEGALDDADAEEVKALSEAHRAWNTRLIEEFVVYLPATAEEIIELAREEQFELGAASLQVRLGWRWATDLEGTMHVVAAVLAAVRSEAPSRIQDWLLNVLEGVDEFRTADGGGSDVIAAACGLLAAGSADADIDDPLWRLTVDFCAVREIPSPAEVRARVAMYVRARLQGVAPGLAPRPSGRSRTQ